MGPKKPNQNAKAKKIDSCGLRFLRTCFQHFNNAFNFCFTRFKIRIHIQCMEPESACMYVYCMHSRLSCAFCVDVMNNCQLILIYLFEKNGRICMSCSRMKTESNKIGIKFYTDEVRNFYDIKCYIRCTIINTH